MELLSLSANGRFEICTHRVSSTPKAAQPQGINSSAVSLKIDIISWLFPYTVCVFTTKRKSTNCSLITGRRTSSLSSESHGPAYCYTSATYYGPFAPTPRLPSTFEYPVNLLIESFALGVILGKNNIIVDIPML
jgi:hypothetical protein